MAVVIDWTFIWLLSAVLLLPFLDPDNTGLRLGASPVAWHSCARIAPDASGTRAEVSPEQAGFARTCTVRTFGFYNGRVIVQNYGKATVHRPYIRGVPYGATTTYRTSVFAVDGAGVAVTTFAPQHVIVPLLLVIYGAVSLGLGHQTIGKRLAGVRAAGTGCAMCREVRKLGVFVLAGLGYLMMMAMPDALLLFAWVPDWATTAVGVTAVVLFCFYFIWPLAWWRGAMPYDRATGFEVVRAG
ncbi:hypothetical protein ABMC88_00925 [Sulfitobacter sp. HNIBRBA2951]|uniref:hypothetical protein n=1 Tax=Sulfitobacter aquimarinus TaxID=3158557 RepID=UPI0032DFDC5A